MGVLKKILKIFHLITVLSSLCFMVLLVLIIFTHVIMRYVFNSGLSWSEEVSSFILVPAFVFLGMALGVDENIHININILSRKIPAWLDSLLDKLKYILYIIVSCVMIFFGSRLALITSRSVLPATEWPASLQYIIMPVSGILIIIISLLYLFKIPKNLNWIDKFIGKDDDPDSSEKKSGDLNDVL